MPKATSITKDMILDSAFEIVRSEGYQSISARNIAKKIGCSTQPIFWSYESMDVLKQELKQKVVDYLNKEISEYRKTEDTFFDMGLGYVRIAHTEPLLFKAIYIENVFDIKLTELVPDIELINALKNGKCGVGIADDKMNDLALVSWIFVHGLASLIATGVMEYDENKVIDIISKTYGFY